MIMAITGRRGRPPNADKEIMPLSRALQPKGAPNRRPGRPPKLKVVDLLSKIDARLLKRLEAKGEFLIFLIFFFIIFFFIFFKHIVMVPE